SPITASYSIICAKRFSTKLTKSRAGSERGLSSPPQRTQWPLRNHVLKLRRIVSSNVAADWKVRAPKQYSRAAPRGFDAFCHHTLCLERHLRPSVIQLTAEHLSGEVADHVRFLRIGLAVAMLRDCDSAIMRFHPEITASYFELKPM